jgi:XTP/dITP diphosphohydrolase
MRKLVFATNNRHKLEEVSDVLAGEIEFLSLKEINCFDEIPETADTLEGNALLKAQYIYNKFGYDCFADDTGLEVEALNGRPGVYSARYAGEPSDSTRNMEKLLEEMDGKTNRKAQFRTVFALIEKGEIKYFEGKITGIINNEAKGNTGFGYDPIFIPDGFSETFAELGSELKNKISHRALAVKEFKNYLIKS